MTGTYHKTLPNSLPTESALTIYETRTKLVIIFSMNLFLKCVDVPSEMIECHDGTQVTLFDGKTRIVIDSGGLGDFHLHGYEVTVLGE